MAPSFVIALALTRQVWTLTCPFGWLGNQRLRFTVGTGEVAAEDHDTQLYLRDTHGRLSRWAGYTVRDSAGKTLYEFDLTVMGSDKVGSISPGLRLLGDGPVYFDEADSGGSKDHYAYVPVQKNDLGGTTYVQIRVFEGTDRASKVRQLATTLGIAPSR